ncbi:MAG: 50S ribosomal protein L6 [Candidatus Protistobacter heckmanni]|nr:50S ribosomal protein L6 [Candidatus Protistobacter heckmanni]
MSRVGKAPIQLPKGVEVTLKDGIVTVKGSLATLTMPLNALVTMSVENGVVTFAAVNDSRESNALQGTMRALVNNMVRGVSTGFEKKLNLVGVGYRAQAQGNKLKLQLGFSHDVEHEMPEGVKAETPTQAEIIIKGSDRQKVGQVAAEVRAYRQPEFYKGKGVRYADEVVLLKETKKK